MRRTITTLFLVVTTASMPALFGVVSENPLYYPLAVGNRWIYVGDRPELEEYEVKVLRFEDGFFVVSSPSPLCVGAGEFKLQARDDAIDIERAGEVLSY